jgi:cell division topological specificity factor
MALLDFIQRLIGLQKPSATTAKERLQLVLAHDRSDLNPELLEQMRREILEVVQKYVEIDLDGGDVSLATEDRVTALVANLPIRRARVRPAISPSVRPEEGVSEVPVSEPREPASGDGDSEPVNPPEGSPPEAEPQDASPSGEPPAREEPSISPTDPKPAPVD